MDVIRCDEQEYLVWKWRPSGEANSTVKENAIRYGSSLRVKPGEVAVFMYKQENGPLMDFIEGPYDGSIATANLPVLTSIVSLAWGGKSPFQAEVYFINVAKNNQIRFAVPYFDITDQRFLDITVPFAVRGSLTFNISDYKTFIKLYRLREFNLEDFRTQVRSAVATVTKTVVTNCTFNNNLPLMQLERKTKEISDLIKTQLQGSFETDFGINVKRLDLDAIEADKESEGYREYARITKEQQIRRAEIDTEKYGREAKLSVEQQYIQSHAINQQTEVLKEAAKSLGEMGGTDMGSGSGMNPAGIMMGMAMGGAMGGQMANAMNNFGGVPQVPTTTPPPVPGTETFFIAANGQQRGPFNMQQLKQMALSGQFSATYYVWKQGMADWVKAEKVSDFDGIFPPPAPTQ